MPAPQKRFLPMPSNYVGVILSNGDRYGVFSQITSHSIAQGRSPMMSDGGSLAGQRADPEPSFTFVLPSDVPDTEACSPRDVPLAVILRDVFSAGEPHRVIRRHLPDPWSLGWETTSLLMKTLTAVRVFIDCISGEKPRQKFTSAMNRSDTSLVPLMKYCSTSQNPDSCQDFAEAHERLAAAGKTWGVSACHFASRCE